MHDPLAGKLTFQLRRASLSVVISLTEGYAALGIRLMDAVMLSFIEANPGCNQASIGNTLGIRRNNLVKIVNGLVDAGHIFREQADGRTYSLSLSETGANLVSQIRQVEDNTESRFFGELDEEERAALESILIGIRTNAFASSGADAKSRFSHLDADE